jgi:hypothetical protein
MLNGQSVYVPFYLLRRKEQSILGLQDTLVESSPCINWTEWYLTSFIVCWIAVQSFDQLCYNFRATTGLLRTKIVFIQLPKLHSKKWENIFIVDLVQDKLALYPAPGKIIILRKTLNKSQWVFWKLR